MKPLTVEAIEAARVKVLANATELFEEAELLFNNRRFPRSYALAQFCCEELAKLPMLTRSVAFLLLGKEIDWKTLDHRLRSHIDKINLLHYQESLPNPMSLEYADEKTYEELRSTTRSLNRRKNESLYVGFTELGPCVPSEVITESIASEHLTIAYERLQRFHFMESLSAGRMQEFLANPDTRAELKEILREFEEE